MVHHCNVEYYHGVLTVLTLISKNAKCFKLPIVTFPAVKLALVSVYSTLDAQLLMYSLLMGLNPGNLVIEMLGT